MPGVYEPTALGYDCEAPEPNPCELIAIVSSI